MTQIDRESICDHLRHLRLELEPMSVDDLRQQLRERGYLTHGIERWFALDPWSSRAFWRELVAIALKCAVLIGAFGSLPCTAVMLFRNAPLAAGETLALLAAYGLAWALVAFAVVIAAGLLLKLRPGIVIDTPAALLAISFTASALMTAPVVWWWWRFDTPPSRFELAVGGALTTLFFLVGSVVVSAALLSFSIHESRRIPAIHRKSRTVPMTIAAATLIGLLFLPAWATSERTTTQPMVVTTPTQRRVALIAVDGLTAEIVQSRRDLAGALSKLITLDPPRETSTTERWASLGTGVRTEAHRVRSIEGIRFRGGAHLVQKISAADAVLLRVAPLIGIARREPLPPTIRRRDYVWEIVSHRGVPSLSVNWWTTADARDGGLVSIGPESVFASAGGDALRVDGLAAARFRQELDRRHPHFATVYLPALDVVLNRLESDEATRLARSLRALDTIVATVRYTRQAGYDVVLVGIPGDHQTGRGILGASLEMDARATTWDIAPTLLDLLGFPLSDEMPGRSLTGPAQSRIATYGERAGSSAVPKLNREYYETLRSLGYVR